MRLRHYIPIPRLSVPRLVFTAVLLILIYSLVALLYGGSTPLAEHGHASRQKRQDAKRYADFQTRSDKVDPSAPGEKGAGVVLKGDELAQSEKLFKKKAF